MMDPWQDGIFTYMKTIDFSIHVCKYTTHRSYALFVFFGMYTPGSTMNMVIFHPAVLVYKGVPLS